MAMKFQKVTRALPGLSDSQPTHRANQGAVQGAEKRVAGRIDRRERVLDQPRQAGGIADERAESNKWVVSWPIRVY